MNLSFAGCGFLSIYHVGVAVCFKKYTPHLLLDKLSGASAGAIAACCLLCDLPLGTITSNVLKVVKEARRKALGPFSPSFNVQAILLESLQKYLPDDAHIRVNGKLHVSLTRVYDGKNVIVSQFNSKEDLLQALLASSFIPLFSGLLPPRFHGIRYMDGGFSDNLPILDENTITISPFCGESDICPRDLSSQLFHVNLANTSIELSRQNIYRFARILFPPNPETLSNMCKQGFEDALRFLHRNNLINCDRCLAVQSTFIVSESIDENNVYDPECDECKIHRQEALVANLPETVMTIFQDAIDSANKGIINWLFKYKGMKLLSLLSLPYTLPADVVYATFTKFMINAPKIQSQLLELVRNFLEQLTLFFPKVNVYYLPLTKTIKCQVKLAEFSLRNDYDIKKLCESNSCKSNWDETDFVIKISECENDTFEKIMQVSSDQEAIMAYCFMDKDNKIHVSEIFDVAQPSETEDIKKFQYNDIPWDDPGWLAQHTLTDVSNQSNTFGDHFHYVDHSNQHCNVFSDPESDWHLEKHVDTRPEVDQPIIH